MRVAANLVRSPPGATRGEFILKRHLDKEKKEIQRYMPSIAKLCFASIAHLEELKKCSYIDLQLCRPSLKLRVVLSQGLLQLHAKPFALGKLRLPRKPHRARAVLRRPAPIKAP